MEPGLRSDEPPRTRSALSNSSYELRTHSRGSSLSSIRGDYRNEEGKRRTSSEYANRPLTPTSRGGKTISSFIQTSSRQPAFIIKPTENKRNGPVITREVEDTESEAEVGRYLKRKEEKEELSGVVINGRTSRAGARSPSPISNPIFSSRNSLPLETMSSDGHGKYASSTMTMLNTMGAPDYLNPQTSYDPLLYKNPTSHPRQREETQESKITLPAANIPSVAAVNPLVPILNAKGKKVRNYKLHAGRNSFYLHGNLMSSSDNPIPFIIVVILSILLPTLFYVASASFIWFDPALNNGGKAGLILFAWLIAIVWSNMLRTALRDPGILPRGLDLISERKWVDDGVGDGAWKSEPKYLRIKEGIVISKWCETCETYRSPRASHCRLCNNCVDHTDHHCTFLNNCIGKRNYLSFYTFLISSILSSSFVIAFSAYHLYYVHQTPSAGVGFLDDYHIIISIIVIILSFLLLVPILGLFLYHTYLIVSNRTTIEMLRPKRDRSIAIDPESRETLPINVFSLQSKFQNFISLLCRPEIPSYISPNQYALVDARDSEGEQIV